MFNIDFYHITRIILPYFLRKPKQLAWLKSLIKATINVYNDFIAYRGGTIDKLAYNSQIIYLEKLLNDKYNEGKVGIYIDNIADNRYTYLYNKSEYMTPIYLYNKSENQTPIYIKNNIEYLNMYDFIVMIPLAVYDTVDLNELKGWVSFYKLAGKRFTIKSY